MREEIDQRPLVVLFLSLCVGLASAGVYWHLLYLLPLLFLTKRWIVRLSAVGACLLGLLIYPDFSSNLVETESFVEGDYDVISMPQTVRDKLVTVVENEEARYLLEVDEKYKIVLGDSIRVRANLVPLNEGQVQKRGSIGKLQVISEPEVLQNGSIIWSWGLSIRQSFERLTDLYGNKRVAALVDGLCFSMTSEIPDDMKKSLSRTGTSHIVATSGLHVVLATFALALVLGMTPVPRSVQIGILFFLLAVYAAAAGLRPPVIRAVLMSAVLLSSYMWRRSPDGLSSVAFAGIITLLWMPETVVDAGFQLSIVAVFSLVIFARLPESEPKSLSEGAKNWLKKYGLASLTVSLATAPIVAYHFGLVPVVSVLANLLVVPVLGVVITGALSSWLLFLVIPASGIGLFKLCVEPLTGWIALVIEKLGSLPFASFNVPDFSAYWIVPLYATVLCLWRPNVRTP